MLVESDALVWSQQVFGQCELGDKRRTRRLVKLGASLASHIGRSVYGACGGDAAANEGAYRLLRNGAVEPEAIAEGGFVSAIAAARSCSEVLALEDTTTLSYPHRAREGLGDLGGPASSVSRGFHVHSVLLVDAASGRTLGLGAQQRLGAGALVATTANGQAEDQDPNETGLHSLHSSLLFALGERPGAAPCDEPSPPRPCSKSS